MTSDAWATGEALRYNMLPPWNIRLISAMILVVGIIPLALRIESVYYVTAPVASVVSMLLFLTLGGASAVELSEKYLVVKRWSLPVPRTLAITWSEITLVENKSYGEVLISYVSVRSGSGSINLRPEPEEAAPRLVFAINLRRTGGDAAALLTGQSPDEPVSESA